MGLDVQTATLLLQARARGAEFRRTATLGRQNWFVADSETRRLCRAFGLDPAAAPGLLGDRSPTRWAEPFYRALGAEEITSLDASGYEGASVVHDLNRPLPPELRGRFDAVHDGGSLEHVFDVAQALRNIMALLRVGGRFFGHTIGNNCLGHGFYQFSPEFFFRVFRPENGFAVERLVAIEHGPRRRWFEVADPGAVRARVTLINGWPVLLFVQARKLAEVEPFSNPPQQSDYAAHWASEAARHGAASPHRAASWRRRLHEAAPWLAYLGDSLLHSRWSRTHSFRNRRFYRPAPKGPPVPPADAP